MSLAQASTYSESFTRFDCDHYKKKAIREVVPGGCALGDLVPGVLVFCVGVRGFGACLSGGAHSLAKQPYASRCLAKYWPVGGLSPPGQILRRVSGWVWCVS